MTFSDIDVAVEEPDVDVEALDEALERLQQVDPRLEQVVSLRYFAGMDIEQTAATLGVSPATVKRDWTYARAWLHEQLRGADRATRAVGPAGERIGPYRIVGEIGTGGMGEVYLAEQTEPVQRRIAPRMRAIQGPDHPYTPTSCGGSPRPWARRTQRR